MANKKEMETVRNEWVKKFYDFLDGIGEDVGYEKSNTLNIPVVGEEGGEYFVKIAVSVPTGGRDGEPYDGYAVREEYQMKIAEKAEKEKAKAEKKKKKTAKSEKSE